MTQRLWQAFAVTLAVVLVGLGVVALMLFLQRTTSQPRATPTPRPSATPSARPSGSGSPSGASASPGGSVASSVVPLPSGSASPSEDASPSVTAGPSVSAAPTPRAAISNLSFTFENVGLDDTDAADARPRAFSFFTDERGDVRASFSGTTGGIVRLCLFRGSPTRALTTPLCFDGRGGFARSFATGGQRRQWTALVSGRTAGRGPTTDVTIAFRGREARVTATGFPLEGTNDPTRNGVTVRFTPRRDGPLFVDATFEADAGAPSDYQLRVRDLELGTDTVETSGNGTSLATSAELEGATDYRLQLGSAAVSADEGVRLDATIVWP